MSERLTNTTADRLRKLEDKVRHVLEEEPRTRDDDRELTLQIHTMFYGINPFAPYCDVMRYTGIPSQESIGRCRRKIQERDESLRGSRAKEKVRIEEQAAYIDYALNNERSNYEH